MTRPRGGMALRWGRWRFRRACRPPRRFAGNPAAALPRASERRLRGHGWRTFSQGDEDGLLAAILDRVRPAGGPGRFLELGSGGGEENITRLLVEQGWSGTWVDADPVAAQAACRLVATRPGLRFVHDRIVTSRILDGTASWLPKDEGPDVLAVDIDGNDWHVLAALLPRVRPAVMVVEYNAFRRRPWVMPYDPDHRWQLDDWFGASLAAFARLLAPAGYRLVGCSITGVNAFFVRTDLADGFPVVPVAELYEPPRFWLIGHIPERAPPPSPPASPGAASDTVTG